MKLTLGFSPCPNDTFIFYALLHRKIDLLGLHFEPVIADVQALNEMAAQDSLDISKLSFAAYASLRHSYELLDSGGALGNHCGPLLISRQPISPDQVQEHSVAIPGTNTTAHFLFKKFFPGHQNKKQMIFSSIEDAVLHGETDLGVIIHENRFTYQKKGLLKVADLGEWWETQTGLPIPLGGIFIKKEFEPDVIHKTEMLIRNSVQYALAHPGETIPFVRKYSQEMDEEVMWQHIRLYVNQFTVSLGETGREAVQRLLSEPLMS
ncbi:MAG: 1,4-dihydroxy-6-naphthoate synthase [Bacteroidetes bacterium]|nr:1,4-dihydroxy-6-naphthoate synthase [Bacteroidota bacterium]